MSKIGKTCALPGCGKTGDSATGKLRVCGGCGVVAYCTVEHQKEHWAKHKQECKQQHKKDSDPMAGHLRKGKAEKDVPVTWDDQKLINRFGLLNARLQDLLDELKESETEVQNLEDAIMEIEEQFDDDACRVRIGDVFVSVSNEEAKERTEKELERSKQKLGKLQAEHEDIQSEMSSLKARLSAKFGDAINLETDEEKEARKKQ